MRIQLFSHKPPRAFQDVNTFKFFTSTNKRKVLTKAPVIFSSLFSNNFSWMQRWWERPTPGSWRHVCKKPRGRSEFNSSHYWIKERATIQCPPQHPDWASGWKWGQPRAPQAVPEAGQQMLWVPTLNTHASWGGLYLQKQCDRRSTKHS